MGIWAKSDKTELKKHIKDILEIFEIIKTHEKIGSRIDPQLYFSIRLAIFYHDFGKVLPKFQISVVGNKDYEPFDIIHDIPHSLFSIFWIDRNKLTEKLKNEKMVEMIISSVAYHHWRDEFDDYITGKKDLTKFFNWVINTKNKLERNLVEEIQPLSETEGDLEEFILSLKINEKLLHEAKNEIKIRNIAIPPYRFENEPLRLTITETKEDLKKWILISGFLQRCDHFASWCESEGEDFDKIEIPCMDYENVKEKIKRKIKINEDQKIWQISKIKDSKDKDVILIAPTGYGKTEFAFLWSSDRKFVYTLPIRSAVNQLYTRACNIFGNDKSGILHSDADIYLLEKKEDIGDNIKLYELSKNLSFPVIISTGDQFFPYALKPPGFEKIFSLFSYSNLAIDEVQAYDPKACAIVVKFIEWVKIMGGNFLLMTATMPEFVREEIKKMGIETKEINIYEEEKEKFANLVKHRVRCEVIKNKENDFEIPEEILRKVIDEAKSRKRILFILNTVKQSQNVYKKLKEKIENESINIFLLHSKYTFEDRRKKEVELIEKEFKNPKPNNEEEGKILVATQVVEASLDIDADILFTEICPLDALIQRMGRVLRRVGPNFKLEKDADLSNPNVYILIFENGLESGNGRVYENELLRLSLAWLWKKSKNEIINLGLSENKEEFFKKEFGEILLEEESNKKSRGKKGKKEKNENNFLNKIIENDGWIKSIKITDFSISEYEKYKIVELFYKSIPKESKYLRAFYYTLEVLEAGYMSDRKKEAEKIFREIYDVNVIPKNLLDKFVDEVNKFIKDDTKNRFSFFKKDILSKFVVSMHYPKEIKLEDWIYYKIEEKIPLEHEWRKKLKKWLSGIYVVDVGYDEELGVL